MHHECTMEAPWMYNEFITSAPRTHHESAMLVVVAAQSVVTSSPAKRRWRSAKALRNNTSASSGTDVVTQIQSIVSLQKHIVGYVASLIAVRVGDQDDLNSKQRVH